MALNNGQTPGNIGAARDVKAFPNGLHFLTGETRHMRRQTMPIPTIRGHAEKLFGLGRTQQCDFQREWPDHSATREEAELVLKH